MSVVRHWVAHDLAEPAKPHVVIRDERELEDHRAYGWTIEGPFVHEDNLTGELELRVAGFTLASFIAFLLRDVAPPESVMDAIAVFTGEDE
jgi:hypothetical protein